MRTNSNELHPLLYFFSMWFLKLSHWIKIEKWKMKLWWSLRLYEEEICVLQYFFVALNLYCFPLPLAAAGKREEEKKNHFLCCYQESSHRSATIFLLFHCIASRILMKMTSFAFTQSIYIFVALCTSPHTSKISFRVCVCVCIVHVARHYPWKFNYFFPQLFFFSFSFPLSLYPSLFHLVVYFFSFHLSCLPHLFYIFFSFFCFEIRFD